MKIDPLALSEAKTLGLTASQVRHMADHGAILTHPNGNRRYVEYVLDVSEGTVWRVSLLDDACNHLQTCSGEKQEYDCPVCLGDGGICVVCNQTGKVLVTATEYQRLTLDAAL